MAGNESVKILFAAMISMLATMKTTGDRVRGIDFEKGGNPRAPGYCVCPRVCTGMCARGWLPPVAGAPLILYYIILYANNWHSGGGAS